jgi:energy-coupling factor transporter ATP-binding protein EcfA2
MRERLERATRRVDADSKVASHAVVVSLADVEPREIQWVWPGWLAKGKLHLLGGNPGDGKSTLALLWACILSRSGRWPDGTQAPIGNTLVIHAEDDLEDTVRPRIDLHYGDPNRIFAMKYVIDEDGRDRAISLSAHVEEIREVIEAHDISFVIFDPITSYLPKADRNAEGDVRDGMMPVLRVIEDTGVCALGIMHIGKSSSQGRKPLQLLLGSTAFGAIARVVMMTAELPEDEQPNAGEDGLREIHKVVGVVKSNISMIPQGLEWSRPLDGPLRFHGPSRHSVGDLLAGASTKKIDDALEFIEDELRTGEKAQKIIEADAKDAGISSATLKRAYEQLRSKRLVRAYKQPGVTNAPWLWVWIGATDEEDAHPAFVQNDELLRTPQEAQPEKTSVFPESSEDAQEAHDELLQDFQLDSLEEAQDGHIGGMSFFDDEAIAARREIYGRAYRGEKESA